MKQKIIKILQPNMRDEVAELKADQIMTLIKIELQKVYEMPEYERHFMFETFYRMCYETEQN